MYQKRNKVNITKPKSDVRKNRDVITEIENKLYPDYHHGSYQRMYIELKKEGEGELTFLGCEEIITAIK